MIAKDFSETPAGRYPYDGKFSGERFREEFLVPNLAEGHQLVVELDGARGYPSSFLEEAFGGLIRKHKLDEETLLQRLTVVAKTPRYQRYIKIIWRYIADAAHRRQSG
ncbi:MAG: STAS-like domain-containing protein [Fimbriimonadaceae bacterium]